ncbi:MAG: cytochrome c [Micropepsaceae bacterium]
MRTQHLATTSLITLALAACATFDVPPDNPQALVNERIAIMKGFVAALTATGQFTQDKATAAAAKAKVAASRAGVERLDDLFPKGTALGDRGVKQSRALSTIFANRADFETKRAALADALQALEIALSKNTKADAARELQQTKSTCGACHTRYRTPDET